MFLVGCTIHNKDSDLIIPGERVGNYILKKSTLAKILGDDMPQNRNAFAQKGLYFQFEQGRELIGITITSSKYVTEQGIRVGSSIEEVKTAYGNPKPDKIKNEKLGIDVLVYKGIIFAHNNGKINAIQVTKVDR